MFFLVWKVLYTFFLFNSNLVDRPLTAHVGNASAFVLNFLGNTKDFRAETMTVKDYHEGNITYLEASVIYHHDNIILNIANVCNGLELIILYIGFIVCMPSSFWRKVKYLVLGTLIIDFINILRCVGLIYLREYYELYFDFAHHYLFKAIVYSTTFLMWYVYSRKIQLKNETI
ncbi:exosortase/archaeosortase family protein [Seonamhaeicola sp.]|uniref:exosortase/archaeosortase family protein n=1 Tax=Seonamhaeicola sp. TaxID=1912245 RepID=UPI003415FCD9